MAEAGDGGAIVAGVEQAIQVARYAGLTGDQIQLLVLIAIIGAMVMGGLIWWQRAGDRRAGGHPPPATTAEHGAPAAPATELAALFQKFGETVSHGLDTMETRIGVRITDARGDIGRVEGALTLHTQDDSRKQGLLFAQDTEMAERFAAAMQDIGTRFGNLEGDMKVVKEVIKLRKAPRGASA